MASVSAFTGSKLKANRHATQIVSGRRVARPSRTSVKVEARRVAVLGAGGGIGQPLSLMLKMNKLVTDLALYDIMGTAGVAADLSHCNTPVKVTGYTGDGELEAALTGCDVVLIPAGVPRKPGMTRDDLFNTNAGIVANLAKAISKYCPDAMVGVITNPVNSTVPICAEIFKRSGSFNPRKLLGVTSLDCVRANTFVADVKDLDLKYVDVPVVGGHSGVTILPLLSKVTPPVQFTEDEVASLTQRIQNAGTEVVEAKAGKGSATLSMAYAAARMTESCLLGLSGEDNIYECTFVATDIVPGLDYFATKVRIGPNGVEEILPLPELSKFEEAAMESVKAELAKNIKTGVDFAKNFA